MSKHLTTGGWYDQQRYRSSDCNINVNIKFSVSSFVKQDEQSYFLILVYLLFRLFSHRLCFLTRKCRSQRNLIWTGQKTWILFNHYTYLLYLFMTRHWFPLITIHHILFNLMKVKMAIFIKEIANDKLHGHYHYQFIRLFFFIKTRGIWHLVSVYIIPNRISTYLSCCIINSQGVLDFCGTITYLRRE